MSLRNFMVKIIITIIITTVIVVIVNIAIIIIINIYAYHSLYNCL